MRPSSLLTLAAVWPLAEAFKFRGAAERAMLFAGYLAEEVFEDTSKMTVATGCKGSRTGIRGQKDRCDIIDFIFHLWEQTLGEVTDDKGLPIKDSDGKKLMAYDAKPDRADVDAFFKKTANKQTLNIDGNDVYKMSEGINKYKVARVPKVRPAGGFTGNLKSGNVFPGKDYFEMMEDFGSNLIAAKNEIGKRDTELADKIKDIDKKLDDDKVSDDDKTKLKANKTDLEKEKKFLNKWKIQVEIGAMQVNLHRLQDDASFKIKGGNGASSLKDLLEPPLKAEHYKTKLFQIPNMKDENGKNFNFRLAAWEEPDREGTIKAAVADGVDEAAAKKAWDDTVAKFYGTGSGPDHKRAIDSINKTVASLKC